MAEHEEVEEHVHHAKEPFDKLVAGTMAGVAALLAIVSVFGQHFNAEKLSTSKRPPINGRSIRRRTSARYVAGATIELLKQGKTEAPPAAEKYTKDIERYTKDMEGISKDAKALEEESKSAGERAESFHMGEVFLEIGIVLSSLAILTKRKPFFIGGAAASAVGLVLAVKAYLMH